MAEKVALEAPYLCQVLPDFEVGVGGEEPSGIFKSCKLLKRGRSSKG